MGPQQTSFFQKSSKAYGGELLKTRKGRANGRPISTSSTMHLVLRSTKATGEWSFKRPKHEFKIKEIIGRFSNKYGVRVLSLANVGNHLHLHIQLTNRLTYKPFIRAITSAIVMAITQISRWKPRKIQGKFWDYRPFTRIVESLREFLNLRDYVMINKFEGFGISRAAARKLLAWQSRNIRGSPLDQSSG